MKKLIFSFLLFFMCNNVIFAGIGLEARIGNNVFNTLEEAINMASSTDIIELVSNVELEKTLIINKTINIDLNGNDILSDEKVFQVSRGSLTITGKGTIKETKPNYGAIMVIGNNVDTEEKYSVVNIGSDVTLEGWSGVFINQNNSKSYGVHINLAGKINAVNDINGAGGAGIYVNGNIKNQSGYPIVNILDNASITSSGSGLYIAGNSSFDIKKAYIKGTQSAIAIKSGVLNIDGATVICDGLDKTPTEGYNNGIKASGTAIQIESNNNYAGNIKLDISSGTFKSKNSNVVYEYIGSGNKSLIYSISVSNGTFISEANKPVFKFTDSFNKIHSGFISGGDYSSDVSSYLKNGYSITKKKNMYNVLKPSVKMINNNEVVVENKKNFINFLLIIFTVIFAILIYFNRLNIIKIKKVFVK